MTNLLTVGFEFNDTFYYSLIREKEKAAGTDYEITVMNGNLEKLLYGNHVIRKRNGCLQMAIAGNSEQELLKATICEALAKFLHLPIKKMLASEMLSEQDLASARNYSGTMHS